MYGVAPHEPPRFRSEIAPAGAEYMPGRLRKCKLSLGGIRVAAAIVSPVRRYRRSLSRMIFVEVSQEREDIAPGMDEIVDAGSAQLRFVLAGAPREGNARAARALEGA